MENSNRIDTYLAFAFGVTFVSIMLAIAVFVPEPTPFAFFVFRVVLALAAAGVGAVIPGFLDITVSKFVRASGAIACFVLIYMVNPPQFVADPKVAQLIQEGESALMFENYHIAKDRFSEAARLAPESSVPTFGLAQAEYQIGNFATAESLFRRAYEKSNRKNHTALYRLALSLEGQHKIDEAIETFVEAKKGLSANSSQYSDIVFSVGQLRLKKFLTDGEPRDRDAAIRHFNEFLETGGIPQHWAHYHLACAHSYHPDHENPMVTDAVRSRLELARNQLRQFAGSKAQKQNIMLVDLMDTNSNRVWFPGDPVVCPILRKREVMISRVASEDS